MVSFTTFKIFIFFYTVYLSGITEGLSVTKRANENEELTMSLNSRKILRRDDYVNGQIIDKAHEDIEQILLQRPTFQNVNDLRREDTVNGQITDRAHNELVIQQKHGAGIDLRRDVSVNDQITDRKHEDIIF
eukprot:Awhi_evm1s1197